MKKLIAIILSLAFVLALVGCNQKQADSHDESHVFQAEVIEIDNGTMLVKPLQGYTEAEYSEQISVVMQSSLEPQIGNIVEITYNGIMTEEAPPSPCGIKKIVVIEEDSPTLAGVSQMKHEEVNEVLSGKNISDLRNAWGEPIESDENGDSWQADSSMIITVKYNGDVVESCELVCGTPLASTEENDELPDKEAFAASNIFTNESNPLVAEDGLTIADILENGTWNTEGTADCMNNIEIIIVDASYNYHSDCGTFNDTINQRSLSLDEATKNLVNSLLAEYISLTATDTPIE